MLQSLRKETEGKLQMLVSPRKEGLDSLFREVRVFKVSHTMVTLYLFRGFGGGRKTETQVLAGPKL